MRKQISFSEYEYAQKERKTRKEVFLEKMRKSVPLDMFCEVIRPHYPKIGNGRQPIELEVMLKMYLVSHWYNLSDEATEDLLYDSMAVKNYVGVANRAPDATTLLRFRHLLETNGLNKIIFEKLTERLISEGLICKEGTIVDATIIEAPTSRKNKENKPTPEMKTTFKKRPYYGMKAHIGVDKDSGLVHSVCTTTANEQDIDSSKNLLHGAEHEVYGDSAYISVEKRPDICIKYQDGSGSLEKLDRGHKKKIWTLKKREDIRFLINKKRGQIVTEEDKEKRNKETQNSSESRAYVLYNKTPVRI